MITSNKHTSKLVLKYRQLDRLEWCETCWHHGYIWLLPPPYGDRDQLHNMLTSLTASSQRRHHLQAWGSFKSVYKENACIRRN